jgi:hypothetical protein
MVRQSLAQYLPLDSTKPFGGATMSRCTLASPLPRNAPARRGLPVFASMASHHRCGREQRC